MAVAVLVSACGRIAYDRHDTPLRDAGDDAREDAETRDANDLADMPEMDLPPDGELDAGADAAVSDMGRPDPGIVVSPTSGLTTNETGSTATFTIVLASPPTADVAIDVTSSNTMEGTVSPARVTFTVLNWDAPITLTVTGVDDVPRDGNQTYTIVTSPATSADEGYDLLDPSDVSVTNIDDESPGVSVSRAAGLLTSETGATDTFTIQLNVAPLADVTIALSSDTPSEASVSPASLTFTTLNWASPQTATVTGVDDVIVDGNQPFIVICGATVSTDLEYDSLPVPDVAGTNLDDETAGILAMPTSGLTTTEAGGTDSFSVVLQSAPSADVTIPIASSNTGELTVGAAAVTFTTLNWNVPQVVMLAGVDDAIADGDQLVTVTVGPATSADADYAALGADTVAATNIDDETAGFTLTPASGLVTTEAGGTATFTVQLRSQPTASVNFGLSSSNISEGTLLPASLTFTSLNWNVPQVVTLTGVDDAIADGDQPYHAIVHVMSSADPTYASLADEQATAVNTDDETAGVTVMPTLGLVTTEAGGTATFTVVLNSQPTADVSISLASDTPLEGTALPASLTFTSVNWSTPQSVTVTGVDDAVADGSRIYHVVTATASSADASYNGLNPSDVTVTNTDDDSVGVSVTPTSGLTTSEAGAMATFTIVLASQPTANVTFSLATSDASEGNASPASVTFMPGNWSVPQTVTVTGIDDTMADGDVLFAVLTGVGSSADTSYNGFDPSDVSVTNTDNDVASVVVSPTSGLVTTEDGDAETFTIVLTSQPTADVTISILSNDASEGTASPASITFMPGNWSVAQTVTVTGVNDDVDDGDIAYTIGTGAAASSDASYNAMGVSDVAVTNIDNDSAGVTVSPTSGLVTTEAGATAMFTVVLATQPTADVVIGVSTSDATEGNVAPASLTFTSMNWNFAQAVTITGVDDGLNDGDVGYSVVTAAATSADTSYNGLDPSDVSATNVDNDGVSQEGYIKASNTAAGDSFGYRGLALSGDGNTMAIGAHMEDSNATGVGGNQADNSAADSGAVYIFTRTGAVWTQQAYVKASNTGANDFFGLALSLSSDGNTLAVGAYGEASNATGIGGNQANNSAGTAGAVYVFTRSGSTWTQEAYVKASNTGSFDTFGFHLGLSSDGNTLAVGAYGESSNATGIGGNQANNSANSSGAVYVFTRSGAVWSQEAYIKASNTEGSDIFGLTIALSADGNTLGVCAGWEDSNATGIGGNQADNSAGMAGAVYVFTRSGAVWSQQAYVKASNTGASDGFGIGLALSADGNTMVVGAHSEDSAATGIGGDESSNAASDAGAVYVYTRTGVVWSQQAYVKASNTGASDYFGSATALSADGDTLVVTARGEASASTGVGANQSDNSAANAGAMYVFRRVGVVWSQDEYVKASNAGAGDELGWRVAMAADGRTIVTGAYHEDSNATGVGGNQADNSAMNSGAAYVFVRN